MFISHTSDIAAYPAGSSFAQAALDAVLKAGLHPVDMGQFAAREDGSAEYGQRRVRECDIYLAVVGFRYGSRVPDRTDRISYAELEFLTATEAGMPRLVFLLGEDVAVPRSVVDRDSNAIDRRSVCRALAASARQRWRPGSATDQRSSIDSQVVCCG